MRSEKWSGYDFDRAANYIIDHEEEAASSYLLDAGQGVMVILPFGLPALGVRFHGIFMLAPIVLFMALLLLFPIYGFLGRWELSGIPILITAICFLLIFGLYKVLKLMLASRDIFPREHFVTLGTQGIAMHFSRLHFPGGNPKAVIPWNYAGKTRKTKIFFLPALLTGKFHVPALEITSRQGPSIFIPHNLPEDREQLLFEFIHSRMVQE